MSEEVVEHIHLEELKSETDTPETAAHIDFKRWPITGTYFGIYRCPRTDTHLVVNAKSKGWGEAKKEIYLGITEKLIRKVIQDSTNNQDQ